MRLQDDLWIIGAYHVDFSPQGELRVVGPGNHLYFGLPGPLGDKIAIGKGSHRAGRLLLKGRFQGEKVELIDPVIRPVRRVRQLTEGKKKRSLRELVDKHASQVLPDEIGLEERAGRCELVYRRHYGGEWYGVRIRLPKGVGAVRDESLPGYRLKGPVEFELVAEASLGRTAKPRKVLRKGMIGLGASEGDEAELIRRLYDRTAAEITHLVTHEKTSGFEYGTVFPRDWMESADLGEGDFSASTVDWMYEKALEYVSPEGEGWHENLVGEDAYQTARLREALESEAGELIRRVSPGSLLALAEQKEGLLTRSMIDIEPRYLMGMDRVSPRFWQREGVVERLRRVAEYVVREASEKELVAFREKPLETRRHRDDVYYEHGNWRDSLSAFRGEEPPMAPYDVNAVFYPAALEALERHQSRLGLFFPELPVLVERWRRAVDDFEFMDEEGRWAHGLAINGRGELVGVHHTDEAYLLVYGAPEREAVKSFVERLLDERYFATASGPTVVGRREEGYDTRGYHGVVIWTKQTAFVSLGLRRSLERSRRNNWGEEYDRLIRRALIQVGESSIRAFQRLGGIPELHYDQRGEAHFYDDQPEAEGQMSKVQLWSAVGARRILRDYAWVKNLG